MKAQSHPWPRVQQELEAKVGELQRQLEDGNKDNAELEEMLKAKQEHIERLKRVQQQQHQEKQQMLLQIEALEEEIRNLQAEKKNMQNQHLQLSATTRSPNIICHKSTRDTSKSCKAYKSTTAASERPFRLLASLEAL